MKPEEIYILVGCEESQAVTIELRKMGFQAFSCDLFECSGGYPEWHYQQDIFEVIKMRKWHGGIFFPPCTHLAVSGAKHFAQKIADGRQQQGIDFFTSLTDLPIDFTAIENPIGIMSRIYRKPDQIIQPYHFGHEVSKSTCLWLKGFPLLKATEIVGKGEIHVCPSGKKIPKWYSQNAFCKDGTRQKARSKTFTGIAKAMANQWGNFLLKELNVIKEPTKQQGQLQLL